MLFKRKINLLRAVNPIHESLVTKPDEIATVSSKDMETTMPIVPKYKAKFYAILLLVVLWSGLIWWLGTGSLTEVDYLVLLLYAMVPILGIMAYFQKNTHNTLMRQFSQEHGYLYQHHISLLPDSTLFFKNAKNCSITNYMNGLLAGHNIFIFNATFQLAPNRSKEKRTYTVIKIILKYELPRISVQRELGMLSTVQPIGYSEGQELISINNDFDKHFDVYVEKGLGVEAHQIFTTELTDAILSRWKGFDIEFIDNAVYVYARYILQDKEDLDALHNFSSFLADYLEPRAKRMHSGVRALHAVYSPK